jgi:hypothetical protein
MKPVGETLREAVESQASAHVGGDIATFASYMTPQALLDLRGNGFGRPRRYEVVGADDQGETGTTAVRYWASGSYVVRQQWERRDGAWRTVSAETPADEIKRPFWHRLLRRGTDQAPERSELA